MRGGRWAAIGILLAGSAAAEPVLDAAATEACIEGQIASDAPVADCVNAAHAVCLDYAGQAPLAAVLCFRQARTDWAALIADRMSTLRAALPDPQGAALEINARYDLLTNLVQCDRMTELMALGQPEGDTLDLQTARCQATASGLAYMKLSLQGDAPASR